MIGRNRVNLIVGWCGRFLFFVVPCQFSQDIGWVASNHDVFAVSIIMVDKLILVL